MADYATLVVSGIAAAASVTAAIIAYKVYSRQARSDLPIATATLRALPDQWLEMEIELINRSEVHWKLETVSVRWPPGAKIVSQWDTPREQATNWNPGGYLPNNIDLSKSNSWTYTNLEVAPATGSSLTNVMGHKPRHSETFFVRLPGWMASSRLSIRANLASNEAVQRHKTIAISRTAPAAVKTASE